MTPAHTRGWTIGLSIALAVPAALAAGPAGVKLDGSLGGSAMALTGPAYNITQNLGTLAGGNLFFSFQYFNIATGETALFSTTSPGIGNVISRVTGGYASTIDGTISLKAASGAPNFFFINPSGIAFTANAAIDVPAAFYVTTANYLKFADGNFYSDPSRTSTLSTAAPEAFGFLGNTRAPIDVTGAGLSSSATGAAAFQIVAGDVTIDGGGIGAGIGTGSGDLRVIATGAQATEVPLTGAYTANDGSVTIQNGGLLLAAGDAASAAGGIYVSAGTLQIDGESANPRTGILSIAGGAGAGPISVNVTGSASIANGGTVISSPAYGAPGADITLNAGSLAISGPSPNWLTGIEASTTTTANGGTVQVNVAAAATIGNGGQILSETFAAGDSGDVTLTAGSLSVEGGPSSAVTQIANISAANSSGTAGRVTVATIGATTIADGAGIASISQGTGNSGDVTVTANSLLMDGGPAALATGISSSAIKGSSGTAADVFVNTVGAMTIANGALISSTTDGVGNAGDVTVNAASLNIYGGPSNTIAGITSSAFADASGNSGKLFVTTSGATTLFSGGGILSATDGSGNAGDVTLKAGSLAIDARSSSAFTGIPSSAASAQSGNSGQLTVSAAGAASITNGGQILSATNGLGNAGDITLSAGSLTVVGTTSGRFTGISSSAVSSISGNSGQVSVITTGATILANGAGIVSATAAPGNAGNVTVNAASLSIDGGTPAVAAGISSTAATGSSGNAGEVSVNTAGATTIANGGEIDSDTSASGYAGDVTLVSGSLSISAGTSALKTGIFSSANDGSSGNAGHVTVTTGSLNIVGGGLTNPLPGISSRTNPGSSGNAGEVVVTTSGATTLSNDGEILSSTAGLGNAGQVTLVADSLDIENGTPAGLTGISTAAAAGSSGSGGSVSVTTTGATKISNGGQIVSDTFASGNAGEVVLTAGSLNINGGSVPVNTGIFSEADPGSSGNAGHVSVTTGTLSIGGGTPAAFAGISSRADVNSSGNAGQVLVATTGAASLTNGGEILSSTHALGNAGDVTLTAGSLTIDGSSSTVLTGISSSATAGSSGNAGQVSVASTGATTLVNGGEILSTTAGQGNAGQVTLAAGSLNIDTAAGLFASEISSSAVAGSGGTAGQVSVVTSGGTMLLEGGQITSETDAIGHAGDAP